MHRNRTLMNGVTLHDKIYKASLGEILERVGIGRVKKGRKYAKIQKSIVEMET